VVVEELFLLFFPPLWLFLVLVVLAVVAVLVVFLPGGSGCGFNAPLSPPVCARDRIAPRNSVIANVNSFFIRFSDQILFFRPNQPKALGWELLGPADVNPEQARELLPRPER